MKEKLSRLENTVTSIFDQIKAAPAKSKILYHKFMAELYSSAEKLQDLASTNYNLGLYHINKGNMSDARLRFFIVTKLRPSNALAHYNLARCYIYYLKIEKAKTHLETALQLDPNLIQAKYRLDVMNHNVSVDTIPIEIIKEDYNALASRYEEYFLKQKEYSAPQALADHLLELVKDTHSILDLGCGTGLVGACLADEVKFKSLTGVDISENMLALTKELKQDGKQIYKKTYVLDFNNAEVMKHELSAEKFDIVTACLSLDYSSKLDSILETTHELCNKEAIFAMVMLKSSSNKLEFSYEQSSLAYSLDDLQEIIKKSQWKIISKDEINIFSGKIPGLLLILERI